MIPMYMVIATLLLILLFLGLTGPVTRTYYREKRAHMLAMMQMGAPDDSTNFRKEM